MGRSKFQMWEGRVWGQFKPKQKLLYQNKHNPNNASLDTRSWAHTYVCRPCLEYPARLRHGRGRQNKD